MQIWMPVVFLFSGFYLAYRYYGTRLSRVTHLSPTAKTPAEQNEDGFDYIPTSRPVLLAQHFASIAAAGPIVGPIAATIGFGWGPTMLWIFAGCIGIGAVHDFAALIASVRSDAKSIPEMAKSKLGKSGYRLILGFIWLCLIYVIIAFTDVTAQQFLATETWNGKAHAIGGGVATSSLLYLLLSVALGIVSQKKWMPLGVATAIFFPALLAIIAVGQYFPISLPAENPQLAWALIILGYCGLASLLPMWILLQPRGYLGGFFLYIILTIGTLGLLFGGFDIQFPAFRGFYSPEGAPLYPFLFITVACGACSGFHGLVCSGTTSKQLARETHAHLVGYGGMLLEGIVAIIALTTVMILPVGDALLTKGPAEIYATGIARFAHAVFGLDLQWGVTFGMLAFATFVYDTLDVATRLGRYLTEELFGWSGWRGRLFSTAATLLFPFAYVIFSPTSGGGTTPLWASVWPLFGSSNQLLAALTLTLMGLWFAKAGRLPRWLIVPGILMMVTSLTALTSQLVTAIDQCQTAPNVISWLNAGLCVGLITLALLFSASCLRQLQQVQT